MKIPGAAWYKSARSAQNGACIEVAVLADAVGVRDSKDPAGPVLIFGQAAWSAFIADVKTDRFSQP